MCVCVFSFLDLSHLCQRIPRGVLEVVYGINITPPQEGECPNRAPYADELLSAYGCKLLLFFIHGVHNLFNALVSSKELFLVHKNNVCHA